MRIRLLYLCATMLLALGLAGCNQNLNASAPDHIESALFARYDREDIYSAIEWETDPTEGYYIASFMMDRFHHCVWFDQDARWLMDEIMNIAYAEDLPKETVVKHFESHCPEPYRECYKVEFADLETRFVIETASSHYFYREKDGDFIKRVDGAWTNRPIVPADMMLHYLDSVHPEATIIDATLHTQPQRMEIEERGVPFTLFFDEDNAWTASREPTSLIFVNSATLAQLVLEGYNPLLDVTASYRIRHIQYGDRIIYGFRLKDTDTPVFIDYEGRVLSLTDIPLD